MLSLTTSSTLNPSTPSNATSGGRCDLSNVDSLENIAYVTYMTIILISSMLGNVMVLIVVVMSTSLRSRVTFYFIASLACSDFVLAVFQIPFRISSKIFNNQFCHALPACYIMVLSDAFGNVASILNLFLISIDRLIAIKFPFRYASLLSKRRVKYLISSVWIISSVWGFNSIFDWTRSGNESFFGISSSNLCFNKNRYFYAVSFLGIYIPSLVVITISYLLILHVAVSQIRAIEASTVEIPLQDALLNIGRNSPRTEHMIRKRKKTLHKELKATKSVAIVYLAFVICWLPSCVINLIIMVDNIFYSMKNENNSLFLFIYFFFIEILPNTNTMVNPLIYSFSNQQFRNAFRTVFYKLIDKRLGTHLFHIRAFDSAGDVSVTVSPAMSPFTRRMNNDISPITSPHNRRLIKLDSAAIWKPD